MDHCTSAAAGGGGGRSFLVETNGGWRGHGRRDGVYLVETSALLEGWLFVGACLSLTIGPEELTEFEVPNEVSRR